MQYIEPLDRNQYQIMSSIEDLVGPDNPVRIIDKIVESIIRSHKNRFEKEKQKKPGRPAYHSSTHIKLYLYGYFNGISSSRKLEVETHRNTEVIWLLGGLKPDHWTISNYRKEKGEEIKFVTRKFREFLKESGYIKLKTVAIDGSKVKANANREMLTKEKIESRIEGMDKKIEEYLRKLSENDIREDIEEEVGNEGLDKVNRKYITEIEKLKEEIKQLENQKEKLRKEGRKYISGIDTDARLMKGREGKLPAYNVQIAVDSANKMIADSEVVTDEVDMEQLLQMVESIEEELGEVPEEILADKGYSTPDLIEKTEKKYEGIEIYVPQISTLRDKEEIKFMYDEEKDEYECSAGRRLVLKQKNKLKAKSLANAYQGIECEGCRLRAKCTKSNKGRIFHRYINQEWRDGYKAKMQSELGKVKTLRRKSIVEHPFGTIKYLMGKIPLLVRGLDKVKTEINIYTTVYNLKRLINIETFDELMKKVDKYTWETT